MAVIIFPLSTACFLREAFAMSDIFVSYRRSDSSDVTGRIFDVLKSTFGTKCLFKDFESIPYGTDFRKEIAHGVDRCRILLAIIGREWLNVEDDAGRRRIENPDDFVRIEISSALERRIPVIPVLVQGAPMPAASDLPAFLESLAYQNAAKVRTDPDFHNDMAALCTQISRYLYGTDSPPQGDPCAGGQSTPPGRGIPANSDNSNRSISIGGSATGNVFQTGNNNVASVRLTPGALPPPDSVDIRAELAAIGELLARLQAADQKRIQRALEDAHDALKMDLPDREAFGEALARALKTAGKSERFVNIAGELQTHAARTAAWLGEYGPELLPFVGLTT